MSEHGTPTRYVHGPNEAGEPKGCRCRECRDANTERARRAKGRIAPTFVDSTRARAHVRELMAAGVGLKTIVARSGVGGGTLCALLYGKPGRPPSTKVTRATEAKLLSVTAADTADGARVDGAATWRRVDLLVSRGWTLSAICRAIGVSPSNLNRGSALVTAAKARAVQALLDEPVPDLPDGKGWNARARARAQAFQREREEAARRAGEAARRARYRHRDDPAPAALPDDWMARATCRRIPEDDRWIFWSEDRRALARAKLVCAGCPVQADCLAYALAGGEHGVWGGTTDDERRRAAA